mmetsp:Transcript_29195/g.28258  ORF Transcript_29195/g.28258 Transcript_29195/m.28258 type:complete len:103 (-) Transcript_29195:669-977(-)
MEYPMNFQNKAGKKDLKIFVGLYPALRKLYFDKSANQLSFFCDQHTIKILPLLHLNDIMLRNGSKKKTDTKILATQLLEERIIMLNQQGFIQEWDLRTGKLI